MAPSSRATWSSRPRPLGVRLLAITDHDNLAAYRELTGPGAQPLPDGLDLMPGVEINCLTGDASRTSSRASCTSWASASSPTMRRSRRCSPASARPADPVRADARDPAPGRDVGRCRGRTAGPQRDRVARPADGRPADDRQRPRHVGRGGLQALARPGLAGLRAARGDRPGPGDHRDPGGRRPAGPGPFRRGRGARVADPRPAGDRTGRAGGLLPDIRSGPRRVGRTGRRRARAGQDRRQRLPRRHRQLCRDARRNLGARAFVGDRLRNALARWPAGGQSAGMRTEHD